MSDFSNILLTNDGQNIKARCEAGETLIYKRVGLGDGQISSDFEAQNLSDLVNELYSVEIHELSPDNEGTCTLKFFYSNEGQQTDFNLREIGFFVQDLDDPDKEALYAIAYSESIPEHIPAYDSAPVVIRRTAKISTGSAENITAVFNPVSPELEGHLLNKVNPHETTKAQIGLDQVDNVKQIPESARGVSVATLTSGKVPTNQLPYASTSSYGISKYATTAEATEGNNITAFINPYSLNHVLDNRFGNVDNVKQIPESDRGESIAELSEGVVPRDQLPIAGDSASLYGVVYRASDNEVESGTSTDSYICPATFKKASAGSWVGAYYYSSFNDSETKTVNHRYINNKTSIQIVGCCENISSLSASSILLLPEACRPIIQIGPVPISVNHNSTISTNYIYINPNGVIALTTSVPSGAFVHFNHIFPIT